MIAEEQHRVSVRPAWEPHMQGHVPDRARCRRGEHTWVAFFFQSGRLAFWECEDCGARDREIAQLTERLDTTSGWIEHPPRLVARGGRPPVSTRRWAAADGTVLVEGEPSSILFAGVEIPSLVEAYTYVRQDEAGRVVETYEPGRERLWAYTDHYRLVRYLVVDACLVRFESYCYEDSTYEVPHVEPPRQQVLLAELLVVQKTV